MQVEKFLLKALRRIYLTIKNLIHKDDKGQGTQDYSYCDLMNQEANDYIFNILKGGKPYLIAKFGTVELRALLYYLTRNRKNFTFKEKLNYIRGRFPYLWWDESDPLSLLCSNAGFFPNEISLLPRFCEEYEKAMLQIDVLGSYISNEVYFAKQLAYAKKVNLDGYYAPFYWINPWTIHLKGKKVLVVHPFAEEINNQYIKRNLIWSNPDILPDFELMVYKSVQSMLGVKTEYATWFDALQKMKDDISKIEFDIALVGCGAYGLPLAAYCKLIGKQAIHLAGWTQVLFGIIGKRWENNPRVSLMMNKHWVRPLKKNTPHDAKKVENACYW